MKITLLGVGLGLLAGCGGASETPLPVAEVTQALDCKMYDHYTAALADATIACTGTVGPDSFVVSERGFLRRTFQSCTTSAPNGLQNVDDLAGLQRRDPRAKACFTQQWTSWHDRFLADGNRTCPSFQYVRSDSAPTMESIKTGMLTLPSRVAAIQSEIPTGHPSSDRPVVLTQPRVPVEPGEENRLYRVSYNEVAPQQPCGTAESCARECTAGLPGFFLGYKDGLVIGDPLWWLSDYKYEDPAENPFLCIDYYHPMSFECELPGDLYAHRNRVGEACSYYLAPDHYLAVIELVCIVDYDDSSCMGRCTLY
jgi:hypothetical protein